MTLPNRFWMPENTQGKPYVTQCPLAAPPYVECVRVDSLPRWCDIVCAPKDGSEFLAYNPECGWIEIVYIENGIMISSGEFAKYGGATSWMTLPDPPC